MQQHFLKGHEFTREKEWGYMGEFEWIKKEEDGGIIF